MTLVAFLFGCVAGLVTGLVPGIHVNLSTALLAGWAPALLGFGLSPFTLAVFIVSAAMVHTLTEVMPTLFLGVPGDDSYALLPGHRLVRRGEGGHALRLSVTGCFRGLILGLVIILAILALEAGGFRLLEPMTEWLSRWMAWLLLAAIAVLVATDERPAWGLFVLVSSGVFGLVVFATPLVPGGSQAPMNALFPALTGLFGASGLLLALAQRDQEQAPQELDFDRRPLPWTPAFLGGLGGMVVGLLPGLGGGNVATLFALGRRGEGAERDSESYLMTTGAINASDALFGIAALVLIDRARSGASVALESFWAQPDRLSLVWLLASALAAAMVTREVLWRWSPALLSGLNRLELPSLNRATLVFLSLMVLFGTGPGGFLVFICGTCLGLVAPVVGCRRAQAMGLFLIPTILFFSGYTARVVTFLGLESVNLPASPSSAGYLALSGLAAFLAGWAVYAWTARG